MGERANMASKMTRRRFIAFAAGAATVAAAGALGGDLLYDSKPSQPETLTVFDQGATNVASVQNPLITEFEARHNVRVQVSTGTADQLVTEFVTETKNNMPTADVITLWDAMGAMQLISQGFAENVVPKSLASQILPQHRSPLLIQHWGIDTIAYNPQKLSQAGLPTPTKFEDLGNPAYTSKIALVDPTADESALGMLSMWIHTLNLGWDFVRSLKANQAFITPSWGPPNGPPVYMVSGSSPIALGDAGFGTVYPMKLAGEPIAPVIPSEGVYGSPQVVVVSRATEKQDLAEAYIEEVIFNQQLLNYWVTQHYLPISTGSVNLPPGVPTRESIQDIDFGWTGENGLNLKLQWQQIFG